MFCPQCRAEYSSGVVTCADCSVSLVVDPAEERRQEPRKRRAEWQFEPLVTSGNPADVHSIVAALEAENIVYYVHDQNAAIQMGHGAFLSSVLVRDDQFDEAERILKDLELDAEDHEIEDRLEEVDATDEPEYLKDVDEPGSANASNVELPCIDCDGWLMPQQRDALLVFQCEACGALWLDAAEATSYERGLARQLPGARLPRFERTMSKQPEPCPRCETTTVEPGKMGSIAAARCAACGGLFLSTAADPA